MRSIIAATAATVLPAGFAYWFTDLDGPNDHAVSASGAAASYAPVSTESGGKRRLSTLAAANVTEVTTWAVGAGLALPVMINPKTSAWYVEGRAAIETNGATSWLFPCSIAITPVLMTQSATANIFCGLGLVGTNSTTFLSFAAGSAGVTNVQTTTIPYSSAIKSYGLSFDGSGTIKAWVEGVPQWTTTNLTQVYSGAAGFHPNQWIRCPDATPTTMLVDYLGGCGPRI